MTQATTTTTPTPKSPEEIWADMAKQPYPGSELYQQASAAASQRLANPYGEFDEAQAKQIEDYYTRSYEEGAAKRLTAAQAQLRNYGLTDSGRHAQAITANEQMLNKEIAENVTVPMMLDDRRRREELANQAIQGAADISMMGDESAQQWAGITGLAPGQPMSAATLGVDVSGSRNAEGLLDTGAQQANFQALKDAAATQGFSQFTDEQLWAMAGGEVIQSSVQTLDAQRVALERSATELDAQIAQAEATGMWDEVETLTKQRQDIELELAQAEAYGEFGGQETLEQKKLNLEKRLEEARISGTLDDIETLEAENMRLNREIETQRLTNDMTQWLTEQTGRIGSSGMINGDTFGIDTTDAWVVDETSPDGGRMGERFWEVLDQVYQAAVAAGLNLSDSDLFSMVKGETVYGVGAPTLAAKQTDLEARRVKMAEDMQLIEADLAEAELTGTLDDQQTLAQQRLNLEKEQQRIDAEIARTDLAMQGSQFLTEQTGLVGGGGEVSLRDLGIDASGILDANGNLMDLERYMQVADQISAAFDAAGLSPSPADVLAMMRDPNASISTDGILTLAARELAGTQGFNARQLAIDAALQGRALDIDQARVDLQDRLQTTQERLDEAAQMGWTVDPETGEKIETLEARQFALQKQLETADRTGKFQTEISPLDFGVDVDYFRNEDGSIKPGMMDDMFVAMETIQDNAKQVYGRDLFPTEIIALINGENISITVNTLAGKEYKLGAEMARAQETGYLRDPITGANVRTLAGQAEDTRNLDVRNAKLNFDKEMTQRISEWSQKYQLDSAQSAALVSQIAAGIENDTARIEQAATQFFAENQLNWATLMGESAGNGPVNLKDVGIDFASMDSAGMTWTDKRNMVNEAFTAAGMDLPNDSQMSQLLLGNDIQVAGSPTLAAKQFAAQITSQSLDRTADLSKFAREHELDLNKFAEGQDEADRQYVLTVDQVAKQYGLDRDQFAMAKMVADAELTGRVGVDGELDASMLGVSLPEGNSYTWSAADQEQYTNLVVDSFTRLQGREPTSQERNNLLNHGTVGVDATPTVAARQADAAITEAAQRFGLDKATFLEATQQFDDTFEAQQEQIFMEAYGYTVDDYGRVQYTTDYRDWYAATAAFNKSEQNRDAVWRGMLSSTMSNEDVYAQDLYADGYLSAPPLGRSRADVEAELVDKLGYNPLNTMSSTAYNQWISGGITYGIRVPNWNDEEMAAVANFVNEHSVSVAPQQQDGTWAGIGQLVGTIASIAL